jgi:hypothetical protein
VPRLAILTLAAALLAGALAAPSQAARPFLLGTGSGPGVAVDRNGTAHIAYNGDYVSEGPGGQALMYCSWPRGARRCTPRPIATDGSSPLAQPALVNAGPAPGEVTVVSARAPITAVRSFDGGATFAASAIGEGRFFDGAFGPGGQLALGFPNLGYVEYYHRSLAGPPDNSAEGDLNRGYSFQVELGFARGRPVLVSGGRSPGIGVSSWTGAGDVHDPATWAGPFKVAESNAFAMARGRRGLFLAHERAAGADDRMVVRRFGRRRFGPARRVPHGRLALGSIMRVGLAQDARGRLVTVWYAASYDRIEVSASRNGRRWTPARVLATGIDLPDRLEIDLGRNGRGVVVWDEQADERVRAVRINARRLLRRR